MLQLGLQKPCLADSLEEAESAKLLENIYRAVNIGLINEMKQILDKFDIDIFNVVNLAATKPFGFQKFLPWTASWVVIVFQLIPLS